MNYLEALSARSFVFSDLRLENKSSRFEVGCWQKWSICLSVCLSVCLSACLAVCLSVCLSVSLSLSRSCLQCMCPFFAMCFARFMLVCKSQISRFLPTFKFKTSDFSQTKCKWDYFSRHFDKKSIKSFYEIHILLYLCSMVAIQSKYITQNSTIIPTFWTNNHRDE